jgi:hypothetical protein
VVSSSLLRCTLRYHEVCAGLVDADEVRGCCYEGGGGCLLAGVSRFACVLGSPSRAFRAFGLSQGAFVCPPCTHKDFEERGACQPVLVFLTAWSAAPGWRLEGNAQGRAVEALENGVCELLNNACLDGAQPHAAREMATRACALFLSDPAALGGTINCGPPSGGKSTMFKALCGLFGATDTEGCVVIEAGTFQGAFGFVSVFCALCQKPSHTPPCPQKQTAGRIIT